MFTECPSCSTVFRVHPSQLEAAGGRVRCGECLAVFDAREYRRDDLEEPAAEPLREEPAAESAITQGNLLFEERDLFREELSAALTAAPAADEPRRAPPPARPDHEPAPEGAVRPAAPRPKRPDPAFDLSFGHDFAAPPAKPRGPWLLAGLLLLALLGGQYLWFNRYSLSQVPALEPAVNGLCGVLPCGLESLPDPGAFELTGRAVQSHPSFAGALLVDVSFTNRTNTARPYPGLELLFTDMEGNLLASRRFTPKEYLGTPPQQPLAAGAEAHAVLELLDPGDLAAGYEFRFF